jgi:hypothetical protein
VVIDQSRAYSVREEDVDRFDPIGLVGIGKNLYSLGI